jgi:hypothetical protein
VNLIDELCVALIPPRRTASFFLGSAVSSSIIQGDSETEFLLEEVVDGFDDDDPFFLVKRLVAFFHKVAALSLSQIYIRGFQPVTRYTNIIWSMDFEWY